MPINHLITPTEWQQQAFREATHLVGTSEYAAKMVEYRRYAAIGEELKQQEALVDYWKTLAENGQEQVAWLLKAVKYLGDKDGTQETSSSV